ncbi:uncharacterized protein KZ484_016720 [Pholidichthys leucotaenia]
MIKGVLGDNLTTAICENTTIMKHITVCQGWQAAPPPVPCQNKLNLFKCPFCSTKSFKPSDKQKTKAHLANHKLVAVVHREYVIYRCGLGCGGKRNHFHCCYCSQTCVNKAEIIKHLEAHRRRIESQIALGPRAPPPLPQPPLAPTAAAPSPQPPLTPAVAAPPPQQPLAPAVAAPSPQPPLAPAAAAPLSRRPLAPAAAAAAPPPPQRPLAPAAAASPPPQRPLAPAAAAPLPWRLLAPAAAPLPPWRLLAPATAAPLPRWLLAPAAASSPPRWLLAPAAAASSPWRLLAPAAAAPPPRRPLAPAAAAPPPQLLLAPAAAAPPPQRPLAPAAAARPPQRPLAPAAAAPRPQRPLAPAAAAPHWPLTPAAIPPLPQRPLALAAAAAPPPSQRPLAPAAPPPPRPLAPATVNSTSGDTSVKRNTFVQCSHCNLTLNKKNIKKHIERKHTDGTVDITEAHHLPAQCIDPRNGIYAVKKSFHGPCLPVHVSKKTWGVTHKVLCDLDICNNHVELTQQSGLLVTQCIHLKSLDYCIGNFPTDDLSEDVLTEMVEHNWFDSSRKKRCLLHREQAKREGVPLAILINLGSPEYNHYISVYEPKVSHYSRLGRVMVHYNSKSNTWYCPCCKGKLPCLHKRLAKWCLFQNKKELFRSSPNTEMEEQMTSSQTEGTCSQQSLYPPQGNGLKSMVQYLYHSKKLPAALPSDLKCDMKDKIPKHLIPTEMFCCCCPGSVKLSDPILISKKAKVATVTGVVNDIWTYCKQCTRCGRFYRYQEWIHGLHNYNDHVLLSLHLCLFIRNAIQAHVAVDRIQTILQKTAQVSYPSAKDMLHAYLHFEALTDHNYSFSCVTCGYYPPIAVMGLQKKGVFNMAVSDFDQLPESYNGEVNTEEFWDTVSMGMIACGFLKSGDSNPYSVKPNFHNWAPWIGRETRKDAIILNTEYQKLHTTNPQDRTAEMPVTEERLGDELLKLKVRDIKNLCKVCGLSDEGSKNDLILRLREEMKNRTTYDKIFQKVWGASGGWAAVLCPCGVTYSVKFLVRAEGPRDFADILLSWKHIPNVSLYDSGRGLAVHANLRRPDDLPFSPHEGQLAEPTEANIRAAAEGSLIVSLPWLKEKKTDKDLNCHPVTGSSDHYILYDRFQENNTKDPQDQLRKIRIVPELAGHVNNEVAKQLFAYMRKNDYFLNAMGPTSRIFLTRNIIHILNEERNAASVKKLRKRLTQTTALKTDCYGRGYISVEGVSF